MIQTDNYSSHLLEITVQHLSRLPGIGKKSALRIALHLLKQEKEEALMLGESIIKKGRPWGLQGKLVTPPHLS